MNKNISQDNLKIAQEARKWKVGDSADRVKNVLKIPKQMSWRKMQIM